MDDDDGGDDNRGGGDDDDDDIEYCDDIFVVEFVHLYSCSTTNKYGYVFPLK